MGIKLYQRVWMISVALIAVVTSAWSFWFMANDFGGLSVLVLVPLWVLIGSLLLFATIAGLGKDYLFAIGLAWAGPIIAVLVALYSTQLLSLGLTWVSIFSLLLIVLIVRLVFARGSARITAWVIATVALIMFLIAVLVIKIPIY